MDFNAAMAGEGAHVVNIMIEDCPDEECDTPYSKVPTFLSHYYNLMSNFNQNLFFFTNVTSSESTFETFADI